MATSKVRSATSASTSTLAPHLPVTKTLTNGTPYTLIIVRSSDTGPNLQDAIYHMFDRNMRKVSEGTSMTYEEKHKREELFHLDARYLLLLRPSPSDRTSPSSSNVSLIGLKTLLGRSKGKNKHHTIEVADETDLLGFCGFRFDTEETMSARDAEVIYCYELHLLPDVRNMGLARLLMDEMEGIGRKRGMDKAMLTCLTNNATALKFYDSCGYIADENDPSRIREEESDGEDGEEEVADYRILSKSLLLGTDYNG